MWRSQAGWLVLLLTQVSHFELNVGSVRVTRRQEVPTLAPRTGRPGQLLMLLQDDIELHRPSLSCGRGARRRRGVVDS